MNQIRAFRSVMAAASGVALAQQTKVTSDHVAFALASGEQNQGAAGRAVVRYGEEMGWTVAAVDGPRDPFWRRRRPKVEPALQRDIEQAAVSGAPDIRAVLRSARVRGELTAIAHHLGAVGLSVDEWLSEGDV